MSEYEYYTNLPYTNYCKMIGYNDKAESEAAMLRIASYRIHQSLVQKPLKIQEYWPLPSDKKVSRDVRIMTPEQLEKIKKRWGLKKV